MKYRLKPVMFRGHLMYKVIGNAGRVRRELAREIAEAGGLCRHRLDPDMRRALVVAQARHAGRLPARQRAKALHRAYRARH